MYLKLYGGDGQMQGQGCHITEKKRVCGDISVELKGMRSGVLSTGHGWLDRRHLGRYFYKGKGHFCVSADRVMGDSGPNDGE